MRDWTSGSWKRTSSTESHHLTAPEPRGMNRSDRKGDPMTQKLAAFSLFVALSLLGTTVWAQTESHKMLKPDDLKWADVPSLPPGAKVAVLEGPLDTKG